MTSLAIIQISKLQEMQNLSLELQAKASAFEADFHRALAKLFPVGKTISLGSKLTKAALGSWAAAPLEGGAQAISHLQDIRFCLASDIAVEFDPLTVSFSRWTAKATPFESGKKHAKGIAILLSGVIPQGIDGNAEEAIATVFGAKNWPSA